MGRVKTFDEQLVLQQAMLVFWKNGYQSTTYAMLEATTGLSGRSLINAFGDKDAIFARVLQLYHGNIQQALQQHFQPPGVLAIESFFNDLAGAKRSDPRNHGCLMLNSVYELESLTPEVKNIVLSFRAMFLELFEAALRAEKISNPNEKAQLLVVCLWGIGSQIRLAGKVTAASAGIAQIMQLLKNWQREGER